MRFDSVVAGGGLAGLVTGILLQEKGMSTAIVSSGENALHFFSGGFGLLSSTPEGKRVECPADGLSSLGEGHPYSRIGTDNMARYASEAKRLFERCGIQTKGNFSHNSLMVTMFGTVVDTWLCVAEAPGFDSLDEIKGKRIVVIQPYGFFDFSAELVADGLRRKGAVVRTETVSLPEINLLHRNATETRSVNIARVCDREEVTLKLSEALKKVLTPDDDLILVPQLLGLDDTQPVNLLKSQLPVECAMVGTMPPSVPGIRIQKQLKKRYEALGGTFLMGDTAVRGELEADLLCRIYTSALGSHPLEARNFVLATGGHFSKGLSSNRERIWESLFDTDVDYPSDRELWYGRHFSSSDSFVPFGIATDPLFHPLKDGVPVKNLYAAGSILGGCDPYREGSGAGIAITTAFAVAENIGRSAK